MLNVKSKCTEKEILPQFAKCVPLRTILFTSNINFHVTGTKNMTFDPQILNNISQYWGVLGLYPCKDNILY